MRPSGSSSHSSPFRGWISRCEQCARLGAQIATLESGQTRDCCRWPEGRGASYVPSPVSKGACIGVYPGAINPGRCIGLRVAKEILWPALVWEITGRMSWTGAARAAPWAVHRRQQAAPPYASTPSSSAMRLRLKPTTTSPSIRVTGVE